MNDQDIRLVAQRQHLRQVEVVELSDGQQQLRLVVRARAQVALASVVEQAFEPAPVSRDESVGGITVKSQALGVFRASHPSRATSCLHVGDTVSVGQSLGLLELKGVYSDVSSPCDGVVQHVLVDEGARVDYGMPLFVLDAASS